MFRSLVVGYGNTLRSDDGIGARVAEIVDNWNLPKVRALVRHQLTPELAAELAQVDLVIFVDACQDTNTNDVKLHPLKPSASINFKSHYSDPRALLGLTQALFGNCPQAWWLLVPGVDFRLGDSLSPVAKQGIDRALAQIENLLLANSLSQKICTK